ncbi:MAG: ATP-grasp domain-containing protein [Leptolyngbyaceae cyanobacterium SM1_1_3]|nr:ATP-grasp domain-containing protein [Leptolyngbyaceae cyanobacterium SM1_1_3]NJN02536.1 ATP-grasp domain-containing protein [Leptolyngbyaceae cyanobacterium RM1_1_2]NJO08556.1 ATP-grasp domain-containing protein [Leptolyngbyaceae cyanobacterium SL_1_1]
MTCTHEAVTGNYLYCGRVLGMTGLEDIIQLHPELTSEWPFIRDHYRRIGLDHTETVIWDDSLDYLEKHDEYTRSVFYFGDTVEIHQARQGWFERLDKDWASVVKFMNSKNNFMTLAHQLNVKVPQTLCFSNKSEIRPETPFPSPCYLKPAVSVDGVGIVRCEDQQALMSALEAIAADIPLQVQAEVIAPSFLNLQYQATANGAERLAATEQILDGFTHQGNRHPASYAPWESVDSMAEWMVQKGMKGIFAFDVAVVADEDTVEFVAIECNPRFNGASYPTGIAHKLGITHWMHKNFKTRYRSLKEIDLGDLEFNPETGAGVILVNWGPILKGQISVLLAGSPEQQEQLIEALTKRL